MNTIDWLLDSDPAIHWQTMRDLTGASPSAIAAERGRVAHEGIGAAILACQAPDGPWRRAGKPDWLPTLYTSLLLRSTGVDPADPAVESATARVAKGFRWHESLGGKSFFEGETEPCINGGALAVGAYFGHSAENLAQRLISEQLQDGGWNCDAPKSLVSSFHSTICVLEGLLEYEGAVGPQHPSAPQAAAARHRAEEYLLQRSLFRRLSTGEIANPEFLELAYPPRYHYDVLRALDYFRSSGRPLDPRMSDAIQFIKTRQQSDGRWLLDRSYDEALALPFPGSVGKPSRWNTLRALRVLRWYDA